MCHRLDFSSHYLQIYELGGIPHLLDYVANLLEPKRSSGIKKCLLSSQYWFEGISGHCRVDTLTGPCLICAFSYMTVNSSEGLYPVLTLENSCIMLVGKTSPHANPNLLIIDPSSFRISFSTKLGKWTFMWLPV